MPFYIISIHKWQTPSLVDKERQIVLTSHHLVQSQHTSTHDCTCLQIHLLFVMYICIHVTLLSKRLIMSQISNSIYHPHVIVSYPTTVHDVNTYLLNCALPVECFTAPPTNITIISSQRPEIEITWEAPANTERRTVLYRVTVSDGTSNLTAVRSIDVTMATLPNLNVLTNYTLYVTAFTETGCVTGPTSVDITVMESECCCCYYQCCCCR